MSGNEKIKKWLCMIITILCSFVFLGSAIASTAWLERDKLLAADGAASDEFGRSVSISGSYAIMGAPHNDKSKGSAYIFKRDPNSGSWSQQAKLTALDGAAGDYFGWSVSISGDFAIVGTLWGDGNATDSGSAYVFKRDGATWIQQQKLIASDGAYEDLFGQSVSISGDYAIVGAFRDDDKGDASGSAYIFTPNDVDPNKWDQIAKLTATDGAAYDCFGLSVSISGDYVIAGACNDYVGSGSAYIFTPNDVDSNNWYQQAKLTASDAAAYDSFSWSVSIGGDYAIVGAFRDDDKGNDSGSAYIFKRNGETWSQRAKLLASDGAAEDYFGLSVSISGDYAIVGAYGDDDKGSFSGSAYIFTPNDINPNNWDQIAKLTASDGAAEDCFSQSVSINGNLAIVGARLDDDKGNASGSAYVFERCPTADLSGDCCVSFVDFAVIGNQWLQAPGVPSADLAPEGGDGVVNFLDLDILVDQWLKCGDPCDPNCQP